MSWLAAKADHINIYSHKGPFLPGWRSFETVFLISLGLINQNHRSKSLTGVSIISLSIERIGISIRPWREKQRKFFGSEFMPYPWHDDMVASGP
jgi:hypothetical protein